MKHRTLLGLMLLTTFGCATDSERDDTGPEGPIARNATEAWPTQPTNVPVVSGEQLLEACATAGSCDPEVAGSALDVRELLIDVCLADAVWSGERAIPMSGWTSARNERVEFWASCVLGANDCETMAACQTSRSDLIGCQEDGCHTYADFSVSCNGSIATMTGEGQSFTRDCSRAFAACDPASPTGCTDRHYSACPDDIDTHDRCDGNIRLGCDHLGQVSFHDCSRLGGICGLAADGTQDCVYPGPISPECQAEEPAVCAGNTLTACVNGRRISIETSFCSSS